MCGNASSLMYQYIFRWNT